MPSLTILQHPQAISVHRLARTPENIAKATSQLTTGLATSLVSLTIAADEISLILPSSITPVHAADKTESGWRAFQVAGTLDFALVGILHFLTTPLKEAGVSVFCVSTYDTDWILVKEDKAEVAANLWKKAGCTVQNA
ncbi:hypothetical protein PhCBS80983_g01194 [Powellomyces hirtus]|uniref:CASTOR ACT domain-containing protein n=1 Tax=Powellomyces hirtus TaxID=109895 RepID=A0A507EBT1_9FUNG|nr:hypothetical protein PhCBS80983_g01194 [Powellomyces hirtus]